RFAEELFPSPQRLHLEPCTMRPFQPESYGPVLGALLRESGLTSLTFGAPRKEFLAKLNSLEGEEAFAPHAVRDRNQAAAVRAALWLYFDFFEESHQISQELATPEGSYW